MFHLDKMLCWSANRRSIIHLQHFGQQYSQFLLGAICLACEKSSKSSNLLECVTTRIFIYGLLRIFEVIDFSLEGKCVSKTRLSSANHQKS